MLAVDQVRVSIIISLYQSHGVLARQVKHFRRMNLPDEVEFVFADDGSNPPFRLEDYDLPNLRFVYTHNTLAWTQGLGRNLAAQSARGEYLFFTDADHMLSRAAIDDVLKFDGDRMMFRRHLAILDDSGVLHQELDVLREYGVDVDNLGWRGLDASMHMNTFAIKRSTFELLGGYDPQHSLVGYHPVSRRGDDCFFNSKWNHYARDHGLQIVLGSPIYVWPIGKFHIRKETNPGGLFHNLSYDGSKMMYKGQENA
jgi:glycosyltransferase involved in cell wall biosynthesis